MCAVNGFWSDWSEILYIGKDCMHQSCNEGVIHCWKARTAQTISMCNTPLILIENSRSRCSKMLMLEGSVRSHPSITLLELPEILKQTKPPLEYDHLPHFVLCFLLNITFFREQQFSYHGTLSTVCS